MRDNNEPLGLNDDLRVIKWCVLCMTFLAAAWTFVAFAN